MRISCIRTDLVEVAPIVTELLSAFETEQEASVAYSLLLEGEGENPFVVRAEQGELFRTASALGLIDETLWHMNREAIAGCAPFLAIHSAAAERDGIATLLPAAQDASGHGLIQPAVPVRNGVDRVCRLRRRVAGQGKTLDRRQRHPHGGIDQAIGVPVEARQRGSQERRDRVIVIADHREVVRDVEAEVLCGREHAKGLRVAGGEDGRRPICLDEHLCREVACFVAPVGAQKNRLVDGVRAG